MLNKKTVVCNSKLTDATVTTSNFNPQRKLSYVNALSLLTAMAVKKLTFVITNVA